MTIEYIVIRLPADMWRMKSAFVIYDPTGNDRRLPAD